jgi:hypothetical protein
MTALYLTVLLAPTFAQQGEIPKNIADSVGDSLHYTEDEFYSIAQAMPDAKFDYIPTAGNFEGVRSFAEQVKHVACANYGFFNEIEGKTPPEHCEKGGAGSRPDQGRVAEVSKRLVRLRQQSAADNQCEKRP